MTAASPLTRAGTKEGGGFAAAHLRGAPRRLRGRSSGLKGASRFLRKWPPATLDPGDLGGPWRQETRSGPGLPRPGARRASPVAAAAADTRTPGNTVNWRSITKREEGKIIQIQVRAPGPVASSQQSHLAKLRHTEPGVHETRDAPEHPFSRALDDHLGRPSGRPNGDYACGPAKQAEHSNHVPNVPDPRLWLRVARPGRAAQLATRDVRRRISGNAARTTRRHPHGRRHVPRHRADCRGGANPRRGRSQLSADTLRQATGRPASGSCGRSTRLGSQLMIHLIAECCLRSADCTRTCYSDARALKSLSMASAPVVRTGRSSRL